MLTDELGHLEVILNKQPVAGTWTAQDLLDRPEMVRNKYLEHVRSFVVLGKLQHPSDEDQLSVSDYEKRLIKLVKEQGAAKGYVTAEYGYGKTSTALFIWRRCEEAEILSVPPFQLQKLDHLITATYGWIRFRLAETYPNLVGEATEIYQRYINRGIDAEAQTESERQLLRRAYTEGRYNPELQALDYIRFFEEMTALVLKARFSGLVVIADELQQYIDPDIKAGVRDPLTPLFDLVQVLLTRKGQLPFALLLSVPRKELGLMNDQRGDLIDRLKTDKLALDLGVVYNQTFASDLWNQLARELEFESLKYKIVRQETLEALGQISARPDLATGPRTVVDAFKLMTRRYVEQAGNVEPFTPLDLINAFLNGDISYDNLGKLQEQINKHLAHQFVRDNPGYQRAIKLMAAFPIDGLAQSYFAPYQVEESIAGLTEVSRGDIITFAGGGHDAQGKEREIRALLVGLEDTQVKSDWLTATIREFIRNYTEQSPRMHNLMIRGFQQLLKQNIFRTDGWELKSPSLEYTLTQNRTYLFQGAFLNTTRQSFPERLLEVRVLGEWEQLRPVPIEGDLVLNFQLRLYYDMPEHERRQEGGAIEYPEEKTITFILNMSHNSGKELYGDLHNGFDRSIAPWKITPALLLSFYAYLDEKRQAKVIQKADDQFISAMFQPALLDHALNELFNTDLGASVQANSMRIVEEVVFRQLEKYYSQYKTFMTNGRWKNSLKNYQTALENLPTPFERQGQQVYNKYPQDSTKSRQDLAGEIFKMTPPVLENFMLTNPLLIRAEGGGWLFTLHPLEARIMGLLKESPLTVPSLSSGSGKPRPVIGREAALKMAQGLGYRDQEFVAAIELLTKRGLVSLSSDETKIIGEETRVPQVTELRQALAGYQTRLQRVKEGLKDNPQVDRWVGELATLDQLIKRCTTTPDEQMQTRIANTIQTRQRDLDLVIQTQQQQIAYQIKQSIQQAAIKQGKPEVLQHTLGEGLFSRQLETQRVSLQREHQEAMERFASLKEQYDQIQSLAELPTLNADELVRLVQAYKHFQKTLLDQQERITRVYDLIEVYDRVRQLLSQGQDLQQRRFQQAPADIASSFQERLDAWSLSVTGDLSSDKLDGLKREPAWRRELNELQQEFEQRLQAERERFSNIQSDYKKFLESKIPQTNLWPDILFNPAEPQDSFTRLWDAVHDALKRAVEMVCRQLQEAHDRAVRLQSGGAQHLPPTERPDFQNLLSALLTQISEYVGPTNTWARDVAEQSFIERVRKNGTSKSAEEMLGPVISQITSLSDWLQEQVERLVEMERSTLAARLSADEEQVLAKLTTLQQSSNSGTEIELGLLFQGDEDQQTWWRLIASLYSKQRLSIKITPLFFE